MWPAQVWRRPSPASCASATGSATRRAWCSTPTFSPTSTIAVTELFRTALGGYQSIIDRGIDFVVAEARLRYHQPAHFDEELTLEVAVTRLGTTSITTCYRVLREADLLVEGTLRHVLVELKGALGREPGAKTAIPDWMREGLTPYLG